jgi:endonuclease V-like protein UPF0215 family
LRRPPARFSHLIGFDDAPFSPGQVEPVRVVGAVFAAERLDGVLSTRVAPDGDDATEALIALLRRSRFLPQLQAILLQGIAFAGFNVVDLPALSQTLELPVLAIARRAPNMPAIRDALLSHVPAGADKWARIQRAGAMEPAAGLWVQRAGIALDATERLIRGSARFGRLPEPLRTAHLIAGGVTRGESRHRA